MERFHSYYIDPIKEIGRGGCGKVEQVRSYNNSKTFFTLYARKMLLELDNDELTKRFKREVKAQASCNHPNIVPIILHNLATSNPWFIMPLAESNLFNDMSEDILSFKDKLNIARDIINALSYLHDKDILHRDIKPINILRYKERVYKLADFGLVKYLNPSEKTEKLTEINQAMGTKDYMAPETFLGKYSKQSDIFSIGVLLDELFTQIDNETLKSLITKATAGLPSKRYKSIEELDNDFQKFFIEVEQDV